MKPFGHVCDLKRIGPDQLHYSSNAPDYELNVLHDALNALHYVLRREFVPPKARWILMKEIQC